MPHLSMMRVAALGLAAIFAWSAWTSELAHADNAAVRFPVPRGAREIDTNYYRLPKRFADATAVLRRIVRKNGWTVDIRPVEKFGKVKYLRILSRDSFAPFFALHLVLAEGRTTLYIVPPVENKEVDEK